MPILSTDVITFHIEFITNDKTYAVPADQATETSLIRDAFECTVQKSSTTDYWDVTTSDMYVRDDSNGTPSESDPVVDFNNTIENDGQDWFVYETDANRVDNLCTADATGTY